MTAARRLWYVARKYWQMNPTRLWWVGHVLDEVREMRRRDAREVRVAR